MANQVGYFDYQGGKNNRYRDSQGNVYHNHLGPALNSIGNAFGIKSGIKNMTDEQHKRLNTKQTPTAGSNSYAGPGGNPNGSGQNQAQQQPGMGPYQGHSVPTPASVTPTVPTRDVQKANGAKGTQTSPGGGMPALTAADAAAFYQSRGIGGFTSNQLPTTGTNPFGGTTIEAVPFGGQEQSVTGNTLGAYMANGQAYAALDPSQPGAAFNPQAPTIEGGSQRINQTPGVTPGNGKGSSRLNDALNDTAGMQSYMSKFGSPEQDMRRAADMAFLNAEGPGSSQMGLRAKQAVLGQFHAGGQTYQLNDDRSEFIQKDGKALAMDGNAASSYRLGTSTAAQYKDSYKDAVKQVATPVTPKQAENPFAQNPAAVSTAFTTNITAGTMAPGSAEIGGMIDVVRGIDGTPPMSSQQISDSFLNKREPLMRDPKKK